MADPHIITALRAKRALLSGDLAQTEARMQRLQAGIAAVDTTLRLFDPDRARPRSAPLSGAQSPHVSALASSRGPCWA